MALILGTKMAALLMTVVNAAEEYLEHGDNTRRNRLDLAIAAFRKAQREQLSKKGQPATGGDLYREVL